eukprot:g3634.t1
MQFDYADFLDSHREELMESNGPVHLRVSRLHSVSASSPDGSSTASLNRVKLHMSTGSSKRSVAEAELDVHYHCSTSSVLSTDCESEDESERGPQEARITVQRPRPTTSSTPVDAADDDSIGISLDSVPSNPAFLPVLAAYLGTAVKSLVSTRYIPTSALTAIESLPLKVSGFSPTDFEGVLQGEIQTHVGLLSLASSVGFIGSLRGLNNMKTAKQGNYMGMAATAVGLLSVLASPGFGGHYGRFLSCFLAAGGVGLCSETSDGVR